MTPQPPGDPAVPKLSVVVASHNTAVAIADCLTALQLQHGREHAEIIVADSSTDGTVALVRQRFPAVRMLHFSEPLTIPQLRGAGIAASRGEIVAILDPYCIVDGQWLSELLAVHARRPEPVVGGAVELTDDHAPSLTHWATYFCEYGDFMPPVQEGLSAELTGNNIAYKRQVLGDLAALGRMGFWKTFMNWRLRAEGQQLWTAPALVVRLRKPIPFLEFFRSRYHHGRCFAAMRVAEAMYYQKCWRALTVPLVPCLALWRQTRSVWPKRRRRAEFLMTVPLLLLLHTSWAWGELWGYLRGPGQSCEQLFY